MKTLFTVLTILGVFAHAQGTNEVNFLFGDVTKDEFTHYFENIKYTCDNEYLLEFFPDIKNYMKKTLKETVLMGMQELSTLNPTFAQSLWRNILPKRSKLSIDCNLPTNGSNAYLETIDIKNNKKMLIGRPILFSLDSDANHNLAAEKRIESTPYLKYDSGKATKSLYPVDRVALLKEHSRQIIFHEFLHFAEADNKVADDHERTEGIVGKMGKLDDVVYACTRTVFRYGASFDIDFPSVVEIPYPPRFSRESWVKSCQTCLGAKDQSNAVTSIRSNGDISRCEKMFDEIPGLKPR
jgi:hypothetical protein